MAQQLGVDELDALVATLVVSGVPLLQREYSEAWSRLSEAAEAGDERLRARLIAALRPDIEARSLNRLLGLIEHDHSGFTLYAPELARLFRVDDRPESRELLVGTLYRFLGPFGETVRAVVIGSLTPIVEKLVEALFQDGVRWTARTQIVTLLAHTGQGDSPAVIRERVVAALRHPWATVRNASVQLTNRWRIKEAAPELARMLEDARDLQRWPFILSTLARLEPRAERTVKLATDAARSREPMFRKSGMRILTRVAPLAETTLQIAIAAAQSRAVDLREIGTAACVRIARAMLRRKEQRSSETSRSANAEQL